MGRGIWLMSHISAPRGTHRGCHSTVGGVSCVKLASSLRRQPVKSGVWFPEQGDCQSLSHLPTSNDGYPHNDYRALT